MHTPPTMPTTVLVKDLVKEYANGVTAIKGINLHALEGEIIGVVGPNGAGKSTTLNILATLIRRSQGQAEICGLSVDRSQDVRKIIGVALQEAGLDPMMTAVDHFDVQGALYRVSRKEIAVRCRDLLEQFDLTAVANRAVGLYSGGMQRRLALALALVSDPRVVIFDEPTSGLDPGSRRIVWRCIDELREQKRTVIFSTHYLEEAQELCDRVYLIFNGAVVREGTPEAVRRAAGAALLRVVATSRNGDIADHVSGIKGNGIVNARIATEEPLTLEFTLAGAGSAATEAILSELREKGIDVSEIRLASPSLEDAFLAMVDVSSSDEALTGSPVELAARRIRGGRRWQ